jgi:hypothetical protein
LDVIIIKRKDLEEILVETSKLKCSKTTRLLMGSEVNHLLAAARRALVLVAAVEEEQVENAGHLLVAGKGAARVTAEFLAGSLDASGGLDAGAGGLEAQAVILLLLRHLAAERLLL